MASTLRTVAEKRILSVRDVEDDNRDSIGREISSLELLIAAAVTDIASEINKKYVECIPDFVTTNKLLDTIRSTCSIVNHSVDSIADNVENMAKEIELNKKELERLESIKDWKLKMHLLEEVESLICQLWYSPNEENSLANAILLVELEGKLKDILQKNETVDQGFAERIGPTLKTEIVTLRQSLTYMLNSFWDQIFSLREFNNKIILHLTVSSCDALNEKLSAMDILNLIDAKIDKLSSTLMHHFCKRLIAAKDPTEIIIYRDGTSFSGYEYVIRKEKPIENEKRKRPDPEKVLRAMLDLFKNLGRNLGAMKVSGKSMVQLIGDKISNEVVELLVHECLTPAIPYDSKDIPAFEALLASTDQFGEEMKKLGFFTNLTESFPKFAENYESTFINRRCSKIIDEARTLIEAPLTEFVSVGSSSDTDEDETIEEYGKIGLNKPKETDRNKRLSFITYHINNTMACWIVTLQGGPKRATQAAVALNDKIYAFGSCWCTEPAETFGVHVLNTIDYRWQRVPTRLFQPNPSQQFIDDSGQIYEPYGESPVHRVGHSVVEYKGKIYLWGGFCHEIGVLCSKMYCFDPEERTWSVIPCASSEATGREKHTAVVFNDMMIVYGGSEDQQPRLHNNVWIYNFKRRIWFNMIVYGDIPRARMNHTACVIDDKMYVFGGVDFLHQELYLNVLDLRHCYWETPDVTGERPYGLVDACCWVYKKQMYIFAGCRHEDDRYIPGLFRYDPEISVWRKMHPFGLKGPSGRQRHCGVIVGDCAYVFCGLAQLISYNEMLGFGCLLEMCDLNVLNFNWKLKDLAAIAVLRYQLPRTSYNLPLELRIHLDMMTTPNHVL